eukprot:2527156-Pleurochrysis_carterae.AAC.2
MRAQAFVKETTAIPHGCMHSHGRGSRKSALVHKMRSKFLHIGRQSRRCWSCMPATCELARLRVRLCARMRRYVHPHERRRRRWRAPLAVASPMFGACARRGCWRQRYCPLAACALHRSVGRRRAGCTGAETRLFGHAETRLSGHKEANAIVGWRPQIRAHRRAKGQRLCRHRHAIHLHLLLLLLPQHHHHHHLLRH